MRRPLLWGLMVAVLAAVTTGAGPRSTIEHRRVVESPGEAVGMVALVVVADLTWSNAPLALDGYAKANLSMRSAPRQSGTGDTYLSLGKGGRSAAPAGAGPFDWTALRGHDAGLRQGGTLGTLGQALQDGRRRWALVTDDWQAVPLAATATGTVPATYPGTADGVRRALQAQPHAVFVAVPHWRLPATIELLSGACTLVVSGSTPAANRSLGVLAASNRCGLGTAGLASPSTHRAHLATLPDVSATFLHLLGRTVPASVTGGPVTPAGAADRRDLVERGQRSWTADRARMVFVPLFVVLHGIGATVAVRRRRAQIGRAHV